MTPVLLALGASAAWGASDFLGGLRAKAVALPTILAVSQGTGLVLALVFLFSAGGTMPSDPRLAFGLLGGVAAVVDLGLIYLVLSRGPVILIAPIAALGATFPVLVGIGGGDPLTSPVLAGLLCALLGSVAASYEPEAGGGSGVIVTGIPLALGAAVGIGATLILLQQASEVDPLWATGTLRLGGFVTSVAVIAVAAGRSRVHHLHESVPSLRVVVSLALIGLFDCLADLGYAFATTSGNLSTVAVLASLYPVVTVALGYLVLRERVLGVQVVGVALALTGVALLAGTAG